MSTTVTDSLKRTVFTTNRAMEFFTESELCTQLGYGREMWPAVIAKELIDNALDACENDGISPVITIRLDADALTVSDNGPGLTTRTIKKSLNYSVRVSDKKNYISPTRGQLGNALKCIWAVPFVVDGKYGKVEVTSRDERRTIEVRLDRVSQTPHITTSSEPFVQSGTSIRVHWPGLASELVTSDMLDLSKSPFGTVLQSVVAGFAALNPHAAFRLEGLVEAHFPATAPRWKKWTANKQTSAHWYTPAELRNLMMAYIHEERAGGRSKPVREFISEFDGFRHSRTQQQVTTSFNRGGTLQSLLVNNDIPLPVVEKLLESMKTFSRPVKPQRLRGIIGKDHIQQILAQFGVREGCIEYKRVFAEGFDGMPHVFEIAFGIRENKDSKRILLMGLNYSPTFEIPKGCIGNALNDARLQATDPVILFLHWVCPKFAFKGHGKGAVVDEDGDINTYRIGETLKNAIRKVTAEFTKQKRKSAARGSDTFSPEQQAELGKTPIIPLRFDEAAAQVMAEAYLTASDNNTLPANARQIMYAARPLILKLAGDIWSDDSYFTQTLLPEYINEHSEETADWDVVYDARGHLTEPHILKSLGIGTLNVRKYLHEWDAEISGKLTADDFSAGNHYPTAGPRNRFAYALFIEKEGFDALLEKSEIAKKYDLAIFSSKGMSTTATRTLVEALSNHGVTILVVHDFDKSGLGIVHNLYHNTRRYQFTTEPNVVDLGLRLDEVREMGLNAEPVDYQQHKNPAHILYDYGASKDEVDFLVTGRAGYKGWTGQRVELNALTARQFISWLSDQLDKHGVEKIIPDAETLEIAFARAEKVFKIKKALEEICNEASDKLEVPKNLKHRIEAVFTKTPTISWDIALQDIVAEMVD